MSEPGEVGSALAIGAGCLLGALVPLGILLAIVLLVIEAF